ncbi:MAG: hypothetical protein HY909_08375 [Deltaproteobacteria bacterium]|nr:hypothetical protein [Deltaproteobacteria bacterium]
MIRVLLREALVTLLWLVAASAGVFAALDRTGHHDWYSTAAFADAAGVPRERATARDLPLFWNAQVSDVAERTARDLRALGDPARAEAARRRLLQRGLAGMPYFFTTLPELTPEGRSEALRLVERWAPTLSPEPFPAEEPARSAWWANFQAVWGLDFREGYATRQAQRLARHASPNAAEQLRRLGTFALPALQRALAVERDPVVLQRLTDSMAQVTASPRRAPEGATPAQVRAVAEAWRAFWFVHRLDYEELSGPAKLLAPVAETRYGRWCSRALGGRFGVSRATGMLATAELRERLPASALAAGLGGLAAVAALVAFGGGAALRRRPLKMRLADLAGATVPGMVAFGAAWLALVRLCAPPEPTAVLALELLGQGSRWLPAAAGIAALAALSLRRERHRLVLHAVRVEAESWALEGLSPGLRRVLRHTARLGVASLLAPLGLAGPSVLLASVVVEPLVGLRGMGSHTLQALSPLDAPWLLLATVATVPVLVGRRWALLLLLWLLDPSLDGAPAEAPPPAEA